MQRCDAAMHAEQADMYSDSADDIATGTGTCNLAWMYPPWQQTSSPAVGQLVSGKSCQLASEKTMSSKFGTFCDFTHW